MRETPFWRRYMRFLGSDPSADVQDELDFHLAMRVEELVGQGLVEADARRQAEREFGDVKKVREELEDVGRQRLQRRLRANLWDSVLFDLKLAARALLKAPGFTTVVAATLALGIGGTTAVFTVVRPTAATTSASDPHTVSTEAPRRQERNCGARISSRGSIWMKRTRGASAASVRLISAAASAGSPETRTSRVEAAPRPSPPSGRETLNAAASLTI